MHLRFHTFWIPVASLQGTGTLRTVLTHLVYCLSKRSFTFRHYPTGAGVLYSIVKYI